MREILCLGDSITQRGFDCSCGWVSQLANAYVRRADVVNRGFSGFNSQWIADLLENDATSGDIVPPRMRSGDDAPLFATVLLGANDAADDYHSVPVEAYRRNLRRIVAFLTTRCGIAPECVVLVTPPAVDADAWLLDRQRQFGADKVTRPNRALERTAEYAAAAVEVAESTGATACDIFTPMLAMAPEGVWKALLCDGLHLSTSGNEMVFAAVMDAIRRRCPACLPDALEMPVPHHSVYDPDEPGQS